MNEEQAKLVIENQRLVSYMIKRMGIRHDFEDLFEVGTIGLCKGALSFDSNKGYQASSYLSKCISNEILMYLRKINKPIYKTVSLDEKISDTEAMTLLDILEDEKVNVEYDVEQKLLLEKINISLAKLTAIESFVIVNRYGLNGAQKMTQKRIKELLRINLSNVLKIEKLALKKLKRYMED